MKKSLFILLATLLLTSCASMSASRNIARLELNMTKGEVVRIMGPNYGFVGSRLTPAGAEEVIRYTTFNSYSGYLLTFLDGKLVAYFREQTSLHDHDDDHRESRD